MNSAVGPDSYLPALLSGSWVALSTHQSPDITSGNLVLPVQFEMCHLQSATHSALAWIGQNGLVVLSRPIGPPWHNHLAISPSLMQQAKINSYITSVACKLLPNRFPFG